MAKKIPNVVARNRIQTPLANALENQQILEQEQILANIIILEDLRDLIPPLQEEEYNRLEQNILTDDEGIREPIKLWKTRILDQEKYVIIDGHNRFSIAQKNGLDFPFEILDFENIEEVKEWMINFQLGRRNLTPEQTSYLRGFLYNQFKQEKGGNDKVLRGQEPKGQNVLLDMTTAEWLAQQYNVSDKTIKRDGQFAEALSLIGDLNAQLKRDLLAGKVKAKKADIQELIKTDKDELILESVDDIAFFAEKNRTLKEEEFSVKRWNKKFLLQCLSENWYVPLFENKIEHQPRLFSVNDYQSSLVQDVPSVNAIQLLHFQDKKMIVLVGMICIGSKAQLKKVNYLPYLEYVDYLTFVIPTELKEDWEDFVKLHALEKIGCLLVDEKKSELITLPIYLDPIAEKTKSLLLDILIQKLM